MMGFMRRVLNNFFLMCVSLVAPGLGHILRGRLDWGLGLFIPFCIVRILIHTLALKNPNIFFFGSILLILFSLTAMLTVLLIREYAHSRGANTYRSSFAVGVLIILLFYGKLDRLQAYKVPSNRMAPTLLAGDTLVIDSKAKYKAGDVVVFQVPETDIKIVRRIERLDGTLAWTISDNPEKKDNGTFLLSAAVGKVLFVSYSLKQDGWSLNPERFSLWIH